MYGDIQLFQRFFKKICASQRSQNLFSMAPSGKLHESRTTTAIHTDKGRMPTRSIKIKLQSTNCCGEREDKIQRRRDAISAQLCVEMRHKSEGAPKW